MPAQLQDYPCAHVIKFGRLFVITMYVFKIHWLMQQLHTGKKVNEQP